MNYDATTIEVVEANITNAESIHKMQISAFKTLLEKYKDYNISPGAEPMTKIIEKMNQSNSKYYIIKYDTIDVGAIRIIQLKEEDRCRISPIFILPQYQNKGIAQIAIKKIEEMYKPLNGWILDTISEEKGNCHLYEKLGYKCVGELQKIKEGMHIIHYKKDAQQSLQLDNAP